MKHARVLALIHPLFFLVGRARGPHGQHADVGSMFLWLAVAAAVIGAISVGAYYAHRAALQRRLNSHPALFDALCKVHRLNRGERALLRQVVRAQNMTFPSQVFTEPGWGAARPLPADLRSKASELARLQEKLFA